MSSPHVAYSVGQGYVINCKLWTIPGQIMSRRHRLRRPSMRSKHFSYNMLSVSYSLAYTSVNLHIQNKSYSLAYTVQTRGGVEDTRLEAKAKDTKKIRGQGQGQPFRGQTLSRPRTGMLEAKDQGHKRKCSPKKKSLHKKFSGDLRKKKGLHKNFSSDLHKKTFSKNFSSAPQYFNDSKSSAILEPRTGQFLRT